MLYPIKHVEDIQQLNELVSLESQVKAVRLQDKLGEQNFHEDMEKAFEPVTKSIKDVSEEVRKTMTEKSLNNIKAKEKLNENFSKMMSDRGMIAPFLASSLANLFKPENKSQFRLIKDLNSTKMDDFLKNGGIPVVL